MDSSGTRRRGLPGRRGARIPLVTLAALALFVWSGYTIETCGEQGPSVADTDDSDLASYGGSYCTRRKDNLRNTAKGYAVSTPIGDIGEVFKVHAYTDWGFQRLDGYCPSYGKIRWRHSTPDFQNTAGVGTSWLSQWHWHTSRCYDDVGYGVRQCLTRLDYTGAHSLNAGGQTVSAFDNGCIATRIGPGGDHHRVVHTSSCYNLAAADSLPLEVEAARTDRQATIEDFVTPRQARRIQRLCSDYLTKAEAVAKRSSCARVVRRAWDSLSQAERTRAAKLMERTRKKYERAYERTR